MISFRHHIVTLAAIFLALAAGVVLGGGPLSEVGRGAEQDLQDAEARNDALEARLATGEKSSTFEDKFAEAVGADAYANGLDGRSVALVTLPGVDNDVLGALGTQVKQAGGSVVGRYAVQPTLIDPGEKSLVDTLGSQLRTQNPAADVDADATTYDRMGQLIGRAVGTLQASTQDVDETATAVTESMAGADLMKPMGTPKGRAPLVVLVLGDDEVEADTDVLMSGLLAGLDLRSRGLVVAGSTASGEDGLLKELRGDEAVAGQISTVDSVQTGAGQVTTMLALIGADDGKAGEYGASGADGAVPLG